MRLLIATPLYPPDLGGPATYARLLEVGLPAHSFDIVLVKFSDVRHLPKVISHISYAWKVFKAAKGADCILALDALSVGWPALFANIFRRKKFVVKMVGDHIWEQGIQRFNMKGELDTIPLFAIKRNPYLSFLRVLQQITLRAANRIIVPSEYLKFLLTSWGIRDSKIEVIYNAIELAEGGRVPSSVNSLSKPLIVTVGRLVPWKRIGGVIDAVASLPDSSPSLCIVGDGPNRQILETQAVRLLPNRTAFTGALAHVDTLATIEEADIFVLNSTYEGLSHVLIEALMLGKPVIATDVGGNSELITDGENGLLVPANDTKALTAAMERVISDSALCERLSRNAMGARERFSAATMRSKTASFLESL